MPLKQKPNVCSANTQPRQGRRHTHTPRVNSLWPALSLSLTLRDRTAMLAAVLARLALWYTDTDCQTGTERLCPS